MPDWVYESAFELLEMTAPAMQREPEQSAQQTLDQISDLFRIGKCARTPAAILANVENVHRFAQMLHAIDREFFTVEGKPDEDYPDDEPQPESLLNCWGSTVGQYVEQFRKALDVVSSAVEGEPAACANCHGVQLAEQHPCPICFEDEPHTGVCGRSDPKALCNREPAPDVAGLVEALERAVHRLEGAGLFYSEAAIRGRAILAAHRSQGGEV